MAARVPLKSVVRLSGLIAWLHVAPARGAVIHVDDSAVGGAEDGSSWADAFTDLQDALAVARAGDEVRVAQGVYKPTTGRSRSATFSLADGVLVQGGWAGLGASNPDALDPGAFPTVLSGDLNGDDIVSGNALLNYADNSLHVVTADATGPDTTIRGLIIRSGSADVAEAQGIHPDSRGGGVACSNGAQLRIEDCVIERCRAYIEGGGVDGGVDKGGGGLTLRRCVVRENQCINFFFGIAAGVTAPSGSVIEHCDFLSNRRVSQSGALRVNNATIADCRFIGNVAEDDGGALSGHDVNFTRCEFIGNLAGGSFGGALELRGACLLLDCLWRENSSSAGGAIHANSPLANIVVIRGDFIDNSAVVGGAVNAQSITLANCRFLGNNYAAGAALAGSGFNAVNCLFSGNHTHRLGGAIAHNGPNRSTFTNCTIVGNVSGGYGPQPSGAVHLWNGSLTFNNCIVWDNTGEAPTPLANQFTVIQGDLAVNDSCVMGWDGSLGGVGTINEDPLLVDADGSDDQYGTEDDDPSLLPDSPCIDAGDTAALPADAFDLDHDGDVAEPIPFDWDGSPRIAGRSVDMGCDEFQGRCPADIAPPGSPDGSVNVDDLLTLIAAWGPCAMPGPIACPADIVPSSAPDGVVGVDDLLAVINGWGTCPE